jgi:uncharacterized spore protein YtfJ
MDMNYEETIQKILDDIKSLAKTQTVIGEQFQLGEFTCVPIIKIAFGFGTGLGSGSEPKKGQGSGGGAGGGIGISPIAFLVTKGDEISVLNLEKKKGLSGVFDKVPDLMEKFIEIKSKEDKEDKEKKD